MKFFEVAATVFCVTTSLVDASSSFGWGNSGKQIRFSGRAEQGTILDKLRSDNRFSKLVNILEEHSGLRDDLGSMDQKWTFFAPTNEALEKVDRSLKTSAAVEELVQYHMVKDEVRYEDMYAGMTLETNYRQSSLGSRRFQRIRVAECPISKEFYLNWEARIEEADIQADNGVFHAVSHVLSKPENMMTKLESLPNFFSTFVLAAKKTGLYDTIEKENGITVFAPHNDAWEYLGMKTLKDLFSTDEGLQNLKRIMSYHVTKSNNVVYADEFIQSQTTKIQTMLSSENICVETYDREQKGPEFSPRRHVLSVNKGESRIVYTDGIAGNGVFNVISTVLVPKNTIRENDDALIM